MEIKFITADEYNYLLKTIESIRADLNSALSSKSNDFDFLNTQQVCELLCISKRTILNYSAANILKTTKLGGLNYYSKSQINELLKKNLR